MKWLFLTLLLLGACKKEDVVVPTEFNTGRCSGWDISREFKKGKFNGDCELTVDQDAHVFIQEANSVSAGDRITLSSPIKMVVTNVSSFAADQSFYDGRKISFEVIQAPAEIKNLADVMESEFGDISCRLSYATNMHIDCELFMIILDGK